MKLITVGVLVALWGAPFVYGQISLQSNNNEQKKVVCYWNSTSVERIGPGKFQIDDLRPALTICTHLVYGYADIDPVSFEVIPPHNHIDTGAEYPLYKVIHQLKLSFPNLKILLSIGGNDDPYEETEKYLVVTESSDARAKFVNSIRRLMNEYQFDGIDLAWPFSTGQVKDERGIWGRLWGGVKNVFVYGKFTDGKEAEYREGFTILLRDLKSKLRKFYNRYMTVTVLPHVDASIYYDARSLVPNIDAVHLFTFDQKTPERNPNDADYIAPIDENYERVAQENIDAGVRFWLENGMPGSKIVVGIPTYARTWKLTSDSQISGVPPINVDGPGAAGPHTGTPGLLSYAEVCTRLTESAVGRLNPVNDSTKKYGSYAFQSYNKQTGADGIWVSYENPDTAGLKASYAKAKGLGGVAIVDLSLDDSRGICTGDEYPILKAAKYKLEI